jgi:hypothetical protein
MHAACSTRSRRTHRAGVLEHCAENSRLCRAIARRLRDCSIKLKAKEAAWRARIASSASVLRSEAPTEVPVFAYGEPLNVNRNPPRIHQRLIEPKEGDSDRDHAGAQSEPRCSTLGPRG